MEKYTDEAKAKWGKTSAFRESKAKLKNKTDEEKARMADGLTARFAEFGKIKHLSPTSKEAQTAVKDLQDYITEKYYTCTMEILAGLGEMYVADARFRENIDKAGGVGTADFVGNAIRRFAAGDT